MFSVRICVQQFDCDQRRRLLSKTTLAIIRAKPIASMNFTENQDNNPACSSFQRRKKVASSDNFNLIIDKNWKPEPENRKFVSYVSGFLQTYFLISHFNITASAFTGLAIQMLCALIDKRSHQSHCKHQRK